MLSGFIAYCAERGFPVEGSAVPKNDHRFAYLANEFGQTYAGERNGMSAMQISQWVYPDRPFDHD